MNLLKSSIFSVFILFSIIVSSSVAFGADAPAPTDSQMGQATLVSTVNIVDAKIVSQKDNTFNISFNFSNGQGLQTGVKYGVQLIPDGANYIADEKVYDESLTLAENSAQRVDITYVAPSQFGGSYTLLLVSKNESGFPFGLVSLGKVKLVASSKGVMIANDSCYLTVEGEKGSPHYKLTQSIDISMGEFLRMTCIAVNNTDAAVSLVPIFETRYKSAYGKVATQIEGDVAPITFTKGEKKTFSLALPRGEMPQSYYLKVGLASENVSSNVVSMNYVVRGVSGSIQKISLDKDYYSAGDKGEMSLLWSASSANFSRGDSKIAGIPVVSLKATIANDKGSRCAKDIEQPLVRDSQNPITTISFDAKSKCVNPVVSASLLDERGKVLDQKDFTFTTSGDNVEKAKGGVSMKLILVVLVIIIILFILMRKKKCPEIINPNAPMQS